VEARRSREARRSADVCGVGQSQRGRLGDPAQVSCGHGRGTSNLIGLSNIKENKWRDLSWCMEDSPAHGFGCH
jgi:hypothetical protein